MHKVFISYYHADDQYYKNELVGWAERNNIFKDGSVDTGDIDDKDMTDQEIRCLIRDNYLRETTVTIVLVGQHTKYRKHVDWEIYSSMFDGPINKKSGIIVILLPSAKSSSFTAGHEEEKAAIYPGETDWITITERSEFERIYPYLSDRLIDNLLKPNAYISVVNWEHLTDERLRYMIECAYKDRLKCEYDLSRQMKRRNG